MTYIHHIISHRTLYCPKNHLSSAYSSLPASSTFLSFSPHQTSDLFIVSIFLPFPKCHRVAIIYFEAFSDWLLSLSSIYLRLLYFFSWFDSSFFVCVLSHFCCVRLFVTPWAVACQAPLSMGFSKQEYRSGLPFLPPGELLNPGIEPSSPVSLYCRQILYLLSDLGKPIWTSHSLSIHPLKTSWLLPSFGNFE